MRSLMANRGIMLPPNADMLRIIRIDNAFNCVRDLLKVARKMAKLAVATDVLAVMMQNPGR